MKTTRTSEDGYRKQRTEHETKDLAIERPRSRDAEGEERRSCYAVVDREPGRPDDDEMFRPFDL